MCTLTSSKNAPESKPCLSRSLLILCSAWPEPLSISANVPYSFTRSPYILPIDFTQNDVNGADDGYQVGDEPAFAHDLKSLQGGERRIAHVNAVGLGGAVGNHMVSSDSVPAFNGLIHLAGGNGEALGDDFEVMDEGFHLGLHFFAIGQDDLGGVGFDRATGHTVKGLLDDFGAF